MTPEDISGAVRDRSAGNFLVARHLVAMLSSESGEIDLSILAGLPASLDDVYIGFLERALRQQKAAWEAGLAPILGALAVSQEPVGEALIARVADVPRSETRRRLTEVEDLLAFESEVPVSRRVYTLYHRSFADFLLDADRAAEYWCDPYEQHERFVDSFRPADGWDAADWESLDEYGLRHLPVHAWAGGSPSEADLILSPAFLRAKSDRSGTPRGVLADVRLAAQHAHAGRDVARLLRWAWVGMGIREQVAQLLVPEVLPLLFEVGREQQAMELLDELDSESESLADERDAVSVRMAASLATHGRVDEAIALAETLQVGERQRGLVAIAAAIAPENPGRAFELARRAGGREGLEDVCSALAAHEAGVNDALELAGQHGPLVSAVAMAVCHRDPVKALKIAGRAIPWDEDYAGDTIRRNADTIRTRIAVAISPKRLEHALRIVADIEDPRERRNAPIQIAAASASVNPDAMIHVLESDADRLGGVALALGLAFTAQSARSEPARDEALRRGTAALTHRGRPHEDPELVTRLPLEGLTGDARNLAARAIDALAALIEGRPYTYRYEYQAVGAVGAALASFNAERAVRFAIGFAERPEARRTGNYLNEALMPIVRVIARTDPDSRDMVLSHLTGMSQHSASVAIVEELAKYDVERAIGVIRGVDPRYSRTRAVLVGTLAAHLGDALRDIAPELLELLPQFVESNIHLSSLAAVGMTIAAALVPIDRDRAAALAARIRERAPSETRAEDRYLRAAALAAAPQDVQAGLELVERIQDPIGRAEAMAAVVPRGPEAAPFVTRLLTTIRELPQGDPRAPDAIAALLERIAAVDTVAAVASIGGFNATGIASRAVAAIWAAQAEQTWPRAERLAPEIWAAASASSNVGVVFAAMLEFLKVVEPDFQQGIVEIAGRLSQTVGQRLEMWLLAPKDPLRALALAEKLGVGSAGLTEVASRLAIVDPREAIALVGSHQNDDDHVFADVLEAVAERDPDLALEAGEAAKWEFDVDQWRVWSAVAEGLATTRWRDALKVAQRIPNEADRQLALARVATRVPIVNHEPPSEVLAVVRRTTDFSRRADVYEAIVERLDEGGDVARRVITDVLLDLASGDRDTFYRLLPRVADVACTLAPQMIDALEHELDSVDALLAATESPVAYVLP